MDLIQVKGKLRPFRHLCEGSKIHAGFIDPNTGEITEICEGGKDWAKRSLNLEEQQKKGWIGFHTSLKDIRPSVGDFINVSTTGCPEYMLTNQGIYEVKATKILDESEFDKLYDTCIRDVFDYIDHISISH